MPATFDPTKPPAARDRTIDQTAATNDSIRAVLRNRAFLRLWLAQAISQTSTNMINFALILRVRNIVEIHHIRQANTAISLVILAFTLPSVLFGPIAGVLADRMNRKVLMAATNVLRAVAVSCFIIIRPNWQVSSILAATYLVTFFFGTAAQFFAPAEGATLPALVPKAQLISANALFNLTFTAAQLVGFATLGPVLIKFVGIDQLFAVSIVLFLICAGLVVALPAMPVIPRAAAQQGTSSPFQRFWADMREGLVYILQDPILMKAIFFLTVAATTFSMLASLAPSFITDEIGLPKEDIGFIVGPAGIGVFAGVLVVARLSRFLQGVQMIDWALALAGFDLLLLALAKPLLRILTGGVSHNTLIFVSAGLAAVLGLCNAFILVPAQTMLQERSNEQIRARVYATFFTISSTVAFVPIFFAAASADLFGVVQVLVVVALILSAIGVVSIIRTSAQVASEATSNA